MADATTRYSLPYQETTDAPNGPTLGQDLAEAVETALAAIEDAMLALPQGTIASHERNTSISGVTTTETGYIRLAAPVRAGYRYEARAPFCNITADATGRIGRCRFRATTSGDASTSSTIIGQTRTSQPTDISQTNIVPLFGKFDATVDGTLSVLWTLIRASGAGSVGLFAAVGEEALMEIVEVGLTPANTGVNI